MARGFSLPLSIFLSIAAASAATELAFVEPNISSGSGSSSLPYYTQGEQVSIRWTTPFGQTTLLVFQTNSTNDWIYSVLAIGKAQSNTSYSWSAGAVPGADYGSEMYLALENANNLACTGCVTRSSKFRVLQKAQVVSASANGASAIAVAGSTTSTARTSEAASKTSSQTPSQTSSQTSSSTSQSAIAGGAGVGSNSEAARSNSAAARDRKIGLGIGLGVGIPLLLALLALIFLCVRRRKKQQKRDRMSYRPTGSGNWTEEAAKRVSASEVSPSQRESGVLGSTAALATLTPSYQSGTTQGSNPFISPSQSASRRSFIEPFDFERPETRDQDAMSQLRKSIHLAPSTRGGDGGSSVYSLRDEELESPGPDAAAVVSPHTGRTVWRRPSERSFSPGLDISSLEGSPVQPQTANPDGSQIVHWRNWPLEQ